MSTAKPGVGLQRYAAFLSVCALLVILIGAAVTSYQPPSVQSPATAPSATQITLEQWHRMSGFVVEALTIGLFVWLTAARKRGAVRWLGLAVFVGFSAEVGVGEATALIKNGALALVHALIAQLLFASFAALAICASPARDREPEFVEDRFAIRTMAVIAPVLVLLQITLGAAYRHKAMGVLTHIFGAFVVAIFILLVGVLAVKQYPNHRSIRPAAVTLMSIAGAQVLLGFAAFLTRLMTDQVTLAVLIFTVAHVVTGALTLAASVFLAIQIRRNVRAASPAWVEPSPKVVSS